MDADWKPYFHLGLDGGIFLLPFIRLSSLPSFLLAITLTACICYLERSLTFLHSHNYVPPTFEKFGRRGVAAWRAGMYGLLTFLRLLYMLVAMTFHLGMLLVVVVSLSVSQYLIEYGELEHLPSHMGAYEHVPTQELTPTVVQGYPPAPPPPARYHPYARTHAHQRGTHHAHRSDVTYAEVDEAIAEAEEGEDSVYGPRAEDLHAAWPYVPDPDGERWRPDVQQAPVEQDGEEDEDNIPLRVMMTKAGRGPGLWGDEGRERAREIMSGGTTP